MRDFVVPRDTQESVIETFRQIRLMLRDLHVPVLTDKNAVQSIAEGQAAYFREADGRLCRWTKIEGELYCEEMPRA